MNLKLIPKKMIKTATIYAYQKSIDDVFTLAYEKYGGTLHNYKMTKDMFDEEDKSALITELITCSRFLESIII